MGQVPPTEPVISGQTKLPLEHFLTSPREKPPVIGLEKNCLSHSTTNNESLLKAFKMACLTYTPTPVPFEQATFARKELITAKQQLMSYCLSKLSHLDLSNGPAQMKKDPEPGDDHPRYIPELPKRYCEDLSWAKLTANTKELLALDH